MLVRLHYKSKEKHQLWPKIMRYRKGAFIICLTALLVWTLHVYAKIEESRPVLRVLWSLAIIAVPTIIALVFFIFKRSLFYTGFFIGTCLLFLLFIVGYLIPKKQQPVFSEETYVAQDYFRDRVGFFSKYTSIIVSYDYPDSIENTGLHIVKNLYRIGNKELNNYYFGKLLIDKKYKVVKEYYNLNVVKNHSYFKQEFGRTIEQWKFVEENSH